MPSPMVNRKDLVVAFAQSFAADPVVPLKLICCESALHAWFNAEEKLDPINSSFYDIVLL